MHGYLEPHTELFYEGGKEISTIAGRYAAIAAQISNIRSQQKNTLVFDGGDTFHGKLPLLQSRGEVIVPVLIHIGFDAMVGHWDFAYGPQQLKNLAEQLGYRVLGINVYKNDGSFLLQPYIMRQLEDLKVAIIGICSNIIGKTMPRRFSEGITITDGVKELPEYVDKVKAEGADIVILLSHNGFPQDVETVQKINGIDICLSAHTHNRLYEPAMIRDSIIIQCGCHGSFLGHLQLSVSDRKIKSHQYELLILDQKIAPDAEIKTMIAEIMQPYKVLQQQVVGATATILHRYSTLNSTMDDFLLQSIAQVADVKIAFSNGWRYGAPVAVGNITKWEWFNIIPMNPVVSTVEITGEEIVQMLEENLERTFSSQPMKQMGGYVKRCTGISVKMRIENPTGNRIQQIFAAGEPLQKAKDYKVAFVTSQGLPEKFGKNRTDVKVKAVDAMEIYFQQHGMVYPSQKNTFSLV